MGSCVIALDVGGTAMKGALLGPDLAVLAELRRPTRPVRVEGAGNEASVAGEDARGEHSGGGDVVGTIGDALAELADLAVARGLDVRGAGVAVPGIVDEETGRAVYSANLGWRDLPLAELLTERLGKRLAGCLGTPKSVPVPVPAQVPVALGHDVRAGARAEAAVGAARGVRDVLFVPIGTGIACVALCDGKALSGGGFAGELGHLTVRQVGRRCRCGNRGCLETVASAAAVATRFTARSGRPAAGAADVVRWLDQGDRTAREVWDDAVGALADALAAAATLLAPELIVLGGGLAEAGDRLLLPLEARLGELLTFQRRPRLVRAALGDRAGCIGAGLMAWERVSGEWVPPERVPPVEPARTRTRTRTRTLTRSPAAAIDATATISAIAAAAATPATPATADAPAAATSATTAHSLHPSRPKNLLENRHAARPDR